MPAQQDLQTLMHLMDLSEDAEGKAKQTANKLASAMEDEAQVLAVKLRDVYRQQGRDISDDAIQAGVSSYLAQRHRHLPKGTSWVRFVGALWMQRTILLIVMSVMLGLVAFAGITGGLVYSGMRSKALEGIHATARQAENYRNQWQQRFAQLTQLSTQAARNQRLIQPALATFLDRNRQPSAVILTTEKGNLEELSRQQSQLLASEQKWRQNAEAVQTDLEKAKSLDQVENRYRMLIDVNATEKESPHAAEIEVALKNGDLAAATQAVHAIEADINRKQAEAANARALAAAKTRVTELLQKLAGVAKEPAPVQRFEHEVQVAGDDTRLLNHVGDDIQKTTQWIAKDYTYRIVMRQGQKTAFVRTEHDSGAKAYYVIVEAIDAFGQAAEKPVIDRENQKVTSTRMWGEEITAEDYEQIKSEKLKKATLSQPIFAVKPAGYEEPQDFNYHAQHRQATRW
ncbi:DUF6384 family protein [Pedosphaera parvula]|uniref:Uncharacterized protein n=1 Tax=Pedosphaera parvula (strain Ellin514) TaxID=320771 RepID=B9XJE1_PEDPL|nr:DUF6384 family protein [Pedosphaera parvula]EEF60002.1 hypothetical protein Cflav_PD3061 [Pedosphaera parvula Ellin514]